MSESGSPLFCIGDSELGGVAVTVSHGVLIAVDLGSEVEGLRNLVRKAWPGAIETEDETATDLLRRVIAFVERPRPDCDLPLKIAGTPFQQRVWTALRSIPPGRTMTYSELATALDAPRSTRAVASAVAANRHAVLIPCHRVVRADGTPSDFRWGTARKRILLARESTQRTLFAAEPDS